MINGILSDTDYQAANGKIMAQLASIERCISENERREECSDNSLQIMKIIQQAFCNADLQSPEILDELVRRFIEKIVVRRIDPSGNDRQKPAYNMEIWLYEAENPVNFDLSLCLRTHRSPDRRTAPSEALPFSGRAW